MKSKRSRFWLENRWITRFNPNLAEITNGTELARCRNVKAKSWYFTSYRPTLFSIALLGLGFAGVMAIGTAPPLWKIGRAVVEWRALSPGQSLPVQKTPVLKLSLRNEGGAGTLPVQIFGRWATQSAPPQSFALLGSYQREVALTQTAIIEVSLTPLASRSPPTGKVLLEMVITTGGKETDKKSIPWN